MDKSDKRGKSDRANALIAKYRNDGDDNYRKYRQGNNDTGSHERIERRQSNPPIDPPTYYGPLEPYKQRKYRGLRNKYVAPATLEIPFRNDPKNHGGVLRTLGNKFSTATVKKNRLEQEPPKFVDEDLTNVDNNVGDETCEEIVEDDRVNASDYNDQEYDEQEADDDIEIETDLMERSEDKPRGQKNNRVEPQQLRGQRVKHEPPQSNRQKISSRKAERSSHVAGTREIVDTQSEDEDETEVGNTVPFPSRRSSWKSPAKNQDKEMWRDTKNLMAKYSNFNRTASESTNQMRKPRKTRTGVQASRRSVEPETIRNGKCIHCGSTAVYAPKTTPSRNPTCRLRDSTYFINDPYDDEGETYEDSGKLVSYRPKPRRTKETRSPIYESRNDDAEIGAIYKSYRSKNSHEPTTVPTREHTRHSVRSGNRQEPSSTKNISRFWS